ncbi:Tetratricopeptide-like helical domain containing protein [Trema orientale]|uniref:Tetratricopeptide-like helical domain containing protein n=1 Tax=Trema orientale TaxID=63057 RepID=A0A2P5E757_TREOI|nr:Tetratricopeptide-like helical domain containing protein [Trema orientale]
MLEVVELKVRVHCKACEKAVRKALCRIKGTHKCQIKQLLSRPLHSQLHPNLNVLPATANTFSLPSLIKAAQSHHSGVQLHCLALKSGSSNDAVVSNSLISMYAKYSLPQPARHVFDTMSHKDTVSWNSIINCYIQNGHPAKALQILRQMYLSGFVLKPELIACIISVCARGQQLRLGREIHALVVTDERIQESVFLSTALLDFYFRCRRSVMALHVFNRMPVKNEVSWTSMISGCAANLNYDMAMDCLRAMQLGWIKHGKEIHGYAVRHGFHSDPNCSAALIHMYCKCEEASPAAKLIFERSTVKDVVLWSSIIGSYARHGHEAKAIKLFNQMQEKGIEPNSVTLLAVISACTSLSSLDLASEVHGYALKPGFTEIFIGNALINMYAKSGCVEAARQFFKEMPIKDSISWSTLIESYGLHGFGEQALQLFHEMQQAGVEADQVTFLSILSACNHSGLVEEGQKIFHHLMEARNKIPLTVEHYACYVDLLGRSGKLEDACEVVRAMHMEASPRIWTSLISCCKLHGRLEVAEVLARQLVKSEPENAANYTLLSMVYAETGNWLGVEEMRRAMQVKGLKKSQGFSQIRLENGTF